VSQHHRILARVLKQICRRQQQVLGAEIGVYKGDLSLSLLTAFPNLHLHLVDIWKAVPADSAYALSGDGAAKQSEDEHLANKLETLQKIEPFKDRATVWHCTSAEAAHGLITQGSKGKLDFVFIDGDHTKAAVAHDILKWWAAVRKGGLITGHDYGHRRHTGVKEAVDEFVNKHKLKFHVGRASVWVIQKPT